MWLSRKHYFEGMTNEDGILQLRTENAWLRRKISEQKQGGNTMRKSDIRDADIVTVRMGSDVEWRNFFRPYEADEYTLKDIINPALDIVKVVRPEQVLWEEEIQTEMTVAELEKKLGIKNLKIIK